MDMLELQQRAREMALGDTFKPREENIDTPAILLEKMPELKDQLKLVGCSGRQLIELQQAANGDVVLRSALYVCHALRFRTPDNLPYFAMTDAQALVEQEYELLDELGLVVKRFLGLLPKAVEDAKNDSKATTNTDGGSESPPSSDAPSPNASELSTTPSLSSGSPS